MVHQQERQHGAMQIDEAKVIVNASDGRKFQGRGRGFGGHSSSFGPGHKSNSFGYQSKECSHCGRTDHIINTCYKKHGIAPNYGKLSSINNIYHEHDEAGDDADDSKSTKKINSYGFTKDQNEKLVSLLQNISKVNVVSHITSGITQLTYSLNQTSLGSWIVNYGSSDHIFSSLKYFTHYKKISPIHLKMPNGHASLAKYVGIVQFSRGLVISKVLFVDDLNLNSLMCPQLSIKHKV